MKFDDFDALPAGTRLVINDQILEFGYHHPPPNGFNAEPGAICRKHSDDEEIVVFEDKWRGWTINENSPDPIPNALYASARFVDLAPAQKDAQWGDPGYDWEESIKRRTHENLKGVFRK